MKLKELRSIIREEIQALNEYVKSGTKFEVIKGYNNRPFALEVGTSTRMTGGGTNINLPKGYEIEFDDEARNGNIWFYFDHPDTGKRMRGKIQSGSLNNLIDGNKIKKK